MSLGFDSMNMHSESRLRTVLSQLRANCWGRVECEADSPAKTCVNRTATEILRRAEAFHTDFERVPKQTTHLDESRGEEEIEEDRQLLHVNQFTTDSKQGEPVCRNVQFSIAYKIFNARYPTSTDSQSILPSLPASCSVSRVRSGLATYQVYHFPPQCPTVPVECCRLLLHS